MASAIEKIGLPRLLEALEANDWSADLNSDPNNDDLEIDSDFDSILDTIEISETGLGRPKSSATQPQELDLRAGLLEVQQTFQTEEDGQGEGEGEGADSQVQELEAMMLKMQAVKGKSRSSHLFSPSSAFSLSVVECCVVNQSMAFWCVVTIKLKTSVASLKMT